MGVRQETVVHSDAGVFRRRFFAHNSHGHDRSGGEGNIAGSDIFLENTAEVTSVSSVDFKNINVNLYTEQAVAFCSYHSMNFYLADGSISVTGDSANIMIPVGGNDSIITPDSGESQN